MGNHNHTDDPWWQETFLEGVRQFGKITAAAQSAGITTKGPYDRRKACDRFRHAWDDALAEFKRSGRSPKIESTAQRKADQWKRTFLESLVATSNVSASAEKAGVATAEVYRTRRTDEAFAADWREALFEGYTNLEMEVLGYLRDSAPAHKLDVAVALRLLAAHKETVAKERAHRASVSAAQVRATIDRKVEELRKRVRRRSPPLGPRHAAVRHPQVGQPRR